MRDPDGRRHFLLGKRWSRRLAWPPAIIGIELHPIGAFTNLLTRDADDFIHAARLLRALRQVEIGRKFRTVTSRRHDRAGDDNHARSGHNSLLDRFL